MTDSVFVEIDGDEYRIRYGVNVLIDMETRVGEEVWQKMATGMVGFTTMRALLWAGLRSDHPEMTMDRAGRLLETLIASREDMQTAREELFDVIGEALERAGLGKKAQIAKAETGEAAPESSGA